jgi:low affinity Fe/Cu permease
MGSPLEETIVCLPFGECVYIYINTCVCVCVCLCVVLGLIPNGDAADYNDVNHAVWLCVCVCVCFC